MTYHLVVYLFNNIYFCSIKSWHKLFVESSCKKVYIPLEEIVVNITIRMRIKKEILQTSIILYCYKYEQIVIINKQEIQTKLNVKYCVMFGRPLG
jgi:hypothetical protein